VGDDVYVSGRARVTHGDPLTVSFRSPSSPAWPPTRSVGAPPTTTAPARLGTARQRRRSGASRTGNRKPKNRVKDEAPPLARRRVGSGLSGFVALSVLACGGGVSFRFCCTCGARCRSGSLWGLFVSGTCGVRLRFGFFSVSCRCSARSVSLRRRPAPARTFGDHLRSISAGQRCCCADLTGRRDHRAALSPRSGVCFSRNAVIVTHRGGTLARRGPPRATGQFNRGSVAPGKAHWVDPHGMMFSPAQRARPNQGPTLPGATGWFHSSGAGDSNTRGRVNTFPAGDCHRRSELHCCRRPSPEGHFRGAAHIIAEQAPAPTVHTPQGHNTAAAHTTRRTIRAPRTHHQ